MILIVEIVNHRQIPDVDFYRSGIPLWKRCIP